MASLVRWEDRGQASFTSGWWEYCPSCPQYELFLSFSRLCTCPLSCLHAESPPMNLIRLMCQAGDAWKMASNSLQSPGHRFFIAAVFTFISTCLKCVMSSLLSILSRRLALHIHLRLAILQTDAIKQWKCFVCFPLARQILPSRLCTSTGRRAWHGQTETSV